VRFGIKTSQANTTYGEILKIWRQADAVPEIDDAWLWDHGPPIMIGAGGERSALRVVARHADIWASPAFTAEEFRRKNAVLDEHCAAIGRDPSEITRSARVFFTAHEPPAAGPSRFPGPAGARELLGELIDAGARHLVLGPIGMPSVPWVAKPGSVTAAPGRQRAGGARRRLD